MGFENGLLSQFATNIPNIFIIYLDIYMFIEVCEKWQAAIAFHLRHNRFLHLFALGIVFHCRANTQQHIISTVFMGSEHAISHLPHFFIAKNAIRIDLSSKIIAIDHD